jgi:hypothetical protein
MKVILWQRRFVKRADVQDLEHREPARLNFQLFSNVCHQQVNAH